jgi:hypothetical protein
LLLTLAIAQTMPQTHDECVPYLQQGLLLAALYLFQTAALAVMLYATPLYLKQPYHTSVLCGEDWVQELIYGHPEHIKHKLGMCVHAFFALVAELCLSGLTNSKNITLEEQTTIFLYACVTGLSICHVGEHFQQHANETISKWVSNSQSYC